MDSVTSTYFFTCPQNSHQPLPSNPEEWIVHLVSRQTADPKDRLAFKLSKRVLKDYATRGELSEEQRERVLSILSQKGFHTYTDDPRFRGLSVCPTKLLLFSPKLYKILFYPEQYPTESALLNTLSHEAFQFLINTFDEEKLNKTPTELLTEITSVITLLSIPELQQICMNSLNSRTIQIPLKSPLIQIQALDQQTAVRLSDQAGLFSLFLQTSSRALLDCPVPDFYEAIAKKFESFYLVITGAKEKGWEELSPLALYRLFLFIQEVSKIFPTLCPLRLKIFDRLLTYLKSGKLNAEYSQQLIAKAQGSFDLHECLKKDQLTIRLKNFKIPISLWSLFPKSNLFQSLIIFHTKYEIPLKEISLEGIEVEGVEGLTEESFTLLYFWMKDKEIDVNSLSVEQLIDLLLAANYLQLNEFDQTRRKIENAIIEQCDDTQESMIALAQIGFDIDCPALNHVISWLNSFSFLSIRRIQEDQKNILINIEIKDLPCLEHLQSALKVLKVIPSNHSIKIELLQDAVEPWKKSLRPLIYLHCCTELGLVQEQQLLETQLLKIKYLEESEDLDDWKNFQSWVP